MISVPNWIIPSFKRRPKKTVGVDTELGGVGSGAIQDEDEEEEEEEDELDEDAHFIAAGRTPARGYPPVEERPSKILWVRGVSRIYSQVGAFVCARLPPHPLFDWILIPNDKANPYMCPSGLGKLLCVVHILDLRDPFVCNTKNAW